MANEIGFTSVVDLLWTLEDEVDFKRGDEDPHLKLDCGPSPKSPVPPVPPIPTFANLSLCSM